MYGWNLSFPGNFLTIYLVISPQSIVFIQLPFLLFIFSFMYLFSKSYVFLHNFLWFLLSALIAVAKTSKTMLNSSGKSGHPCLVPDFRGNAFNFSPLRIMFAVGLSYMAFIMLRYVPSMSAFWKVLS